MLNSVFPFTIEILFNVKIEEKYFLSGTTYEATAAVFKEIDKCHDFGQKYCGDVLHYVVQDSMRNYLLPAPCVAIVPNMRDPEKAYRMKYWIDKSQGAEVRDYVLLAYQMHGVSIAAKDGISQADIANQKVLETLYGTKTEKEVGQPVEIIVKDFEKLQSNAQERAIPAEVIINIISARFFRGETLVYSVAISKQPETNVEIAISSSLPELALSETILEFTPENYNKSQEVMITVEPLADLDKDKIGEITHQCNWPGETVKEVKISVLLKADR